MLVKLGSQGEDVKKVQAVLKIDISGIFDESTKQDVADWQAKHGLFNDGIVGDVTWKVMSQPVYNLSNLKGYIPDSVLSQIPLVADKYGIHSSLRLAHFLAQASHESAGFTAFTENLNYSAQGLLKTFPYYFKTLEQANAYANQPEKIANKVYGNRLGNGNEASGEGWKFRGRGYLQLTGKENYQSLAKSLNIDLVSSPELVGSQYPLASAGWFFKKNQLLTICDNGISNETIEQLTKRINGGLIGITDRIAKTQKFAKLLQVTA